MNTVARVNIWGMMVGAIAWRDETGYAVFEFDPDFIKKGVNLAPLKMPLEEALNGRMIYSFPELNNTTFKGLPGMLVESLPDRFGNTIIDAWLARRGGEQNFNSVERLCYIGKRGMGALEFEPVIPLIDDVSESIQISELVNLTKEILNERKDLAVNIHDETTDGLLKIIRVGTSAGGNRAKAIIAYNENTGDVRSGQIDGLKDYSYWIIKFDGINDKELGDPKGYCKIEYAYYLMATDCGIIMTECKTLNENHRTHFMTKRFDRDGINKIHMQSLCSIAHFDFNLAGAYSYEQAFQIMRKLKLQYSDHEQLYRRMVFNVIARNQDDHTKNISFLMDKAGKWGLSPAYDVTYAYNPDNIWLRSHQMSINGKRDDITGNDLIEVAENMNIKKPKEIIQIVLETVSCWREYAKKANVNAEHQKKIYNALQLKI
ncbi:MAG: type II toxin-antitoxin system HipA family toxin [Ignavibacteriae bacterium]|nr:MAG: type II toxin-antitoxin system HipA family toxin [Ignavibacteriota bacterium]